MVADLETARASWAARGIELIESEDGLDCLMGCLERPPAQPFVLRVDWARFLAELPPNAAVPILDELGRGLSQASVVAPSPAARDELLERLQGVPEAGRLRALRSVVESHATHVLGLSDSTQLDAHQPLHDLGLDSLMAVELRNVLSACVGTLLPATLLFDYPTLQALTDYLAREVLALDEEAPPPSAAVDAQEAQIATAVEKLSDEDLEESLLDELKDAGY